MKLPEGWREVELGEICMGFTPMGSISKENLGYFKKQSNGIIKLVDKF